MPKWDATHMNTSLYEGKPLLHNYGQDIDELLKKREMARHNLREAERSLLELGAKTFFDENLQCLEDLDVQKYLACGNQEFAWEAVYKDGTILKQFEDDGRQHHFGNIHQEHLASIRWCSNFSVHTSNDDKRVILEIDWVSGIVIGHNVQSSQEFRNLLLSKKPDGAKLILKMVKRQSVAPSYTEINRGCTTLYNRYLLGWESDNEKVLLCIEPSGYVHLWHDQK